MHASALLLFAAATATTADPAHSSGEPRPRRIEQLQWLAGHWRDASGTEEVWLAPAAGAMHGLNRNVGAGGADVEHLRIVERDGTLVYVAAPDGQPATEFTATAVSASEARFDNLAHDFPTWIRYRLLAADRLSACVGGATRALCWEWQRRGQLP